MSDADFQVLMIVTAVLTTGIFFVAVLNTIKLAFEMFFQLANMVGEKEGKVDVTVESLVTACTWAVFFVFNILLKILLTKV
jgi:hypothetical protein